MRFLIKKLCLILMAMALIVTSLPITSFANGPDTNQGGTITISNVTPGDTFKALKIIDVAYDGENIIRGWNQDSLAYVFVGEEPLNITPSCTVEEYIAMDAKAKSALIDPIKSFFMNTNGEGSLTVKSADENGIVTFNIENSIGWGSYLILCNSEGKEDNYSDMVGSVQPVWNTESDTWEIIGDEIVAKKTVLNLSYQVSTAEDGTYSDGVNAGSWNTLYYQIESDVPQYDSSVEAVERKFLIENTIAEGITAPTDANIKAYGSIDGTNFTEDITSSVSLNGTSFDLTSAMSGDQYTKIRIQYNTVFEKAADGNQGVSDKVILGKAGNSSTVKATYNNYDGSESGKSTEATATVYTYGLEIMATNRNVPMSGVEFKVYRSDEGGLEKISYKGNEDTQPKDIDGILLGTIISNNDGIATYRGLIEGANYYVQDANEELLLTAEKIDTNDEDNDGIYQCAVKKEEPVITLPETGGRGTMIFTISGISLMVSAIVLLFIIKKRVTISK